MACRTDQITIIGLRYNLYHQDTYAIRAPCNYLVYPTDGRAFPPLISSPYCGVNENGTPINANVNTKYCRCALIGRTTVNHTQFALVIRHTIYRQTQKSFVCFFSSCGPALWYTGITYVLFKGEYENVTSSVHNLSPWGTGCSPMNRWSTALSLRLERLVDVVIPMAEPTTN